MTTKAKSKWQPFILALFCFLGTLLLFFFQSFQAEETLFSNDAPLGAYMSQADQAIHNFTGAWQPLNWIGTKMISASPNFTNALFLIYGPINYSKFYAPTSILILGIAGWLLFRQLGLNSAACILGAIGLMLNADPFSYACWGLPSVTLSIASFVLALAAAAKIEGTRRWIRIIVAGVCVGMSLMEGYDVGAILSLYVAAFVIFQRIAAEKSKAFSGSMISKAAIQTAIVAIVAAFAAAHTLSVLINTQIKGVAGMQQDDQTKEERWDFATQWSLPKIETLRFVIPGLFGYRMDTPDGGSYWGAVGQQPGWEQHHQGIPRHSGSGPYAGVVVVFVAFWAVFHAFRPNASNPFSPQQKRLILFWTGAAGLSLLFAFGRHAPFYRIIYSLPFFSTIRNPIKFIHPLSVCLAILFAYGLHGLLQRCFASARQTGHSVKDCLKTWWKAGSSSDRKWAFASIIVLGIALLAWLLYAGSSRDLERYLVTIAVDPSIAGSTARYSIREFGIFLFFFAAVLGLCFLILSGCFFGNRARWVPILFAVLLIADFVHANQPWVVYYNYKEDYASNPVLDLLKTAPETRRVAGRLHPQIQIHATATNDLAFPALYENWLQHEFQFYKIQSLDIVQMPRTPELDQSFLNAFKPSNASQWQLPGRLWRLTNTRFILGLKPYLEFLNQRFDPVEKRFRIHTTFDLAPKDPSRPVRTVSDLSVVLNANGQYAVFEFTGALPRAQLYSNWQTSKDDPETLQQLVGPDFDPAQKVIVTGSVPAPQENRAGASTGTVTITSYTTKDILLKSQSSSPSVLLLNDRYDPDWRVLVDGKPSPLLRANYIMRGVHLDPGEHNIEFRFTPPVGGLYLSLIMVVVGIALCGLLALGPKSETVVSEQTAHLKAAG